MTDPYAAIAELYDLEHDAYTDDLDFYRQLAARTGGPILEIGCGTGRVAVPLARAGHRTIGLDRSAAMIDRARVRGADVADRLTWIVGDLREAAPVEPVRLAIAALNTWNHLTDLADQSAALDRVVAWLAPGGTIAIELSPPDLGLITQPDDLVRLLWTGRGPVTGETIARFEARRTDETRQVQHVTLYYDRIDHAGVCRRVLTQFDQRYTFPGEIAALFERAGLIGHNYVGSYDLEPYQAGSERLIAIAQRPTRRRRKSAAWSQ